MIRPGEEWARPAPPIEGRPAARTDAELARLVGEGHRIVLLEGGDLHRTLGSPSAARLSTGEARAFDIDLGQLILDGGRPVIFAAHLVAGSARWWSRRTVVVMNAAFIGDANLGPRAHPGDGLLDITDGRLGWRSRRQARRRWGAGAHLPHPGLSTSRRPRLVVEFDQAVPIWLDGVRRGRGRHLDIEVLPHSLTVVC